MGDVTVNLGLWSVKINNGLFILTNNNELKFSSKTSQLCLPYSVLQIADQIVSHGLVDCLFNVDAIKRSCAVLLQYEPHHSYKIFPTCVSDLSFDLVVLVKSNCHVLQPHAFHVLLAFVSPIPSSVVACNLNKDQEPVFVPAHYHTGVLSTVQQAPHTVLQLTSPAIRNASNEYEFFFCGPNFQKCVQLQDMSVKNDSSLDELEVKSLCIQQVSSDFFKVSFSLLPNCLLDTVYFKAKIVISTVPQVLFLHYLGWYSLNSCCQVVPFYIDQEKSLKPYETCKVKVKTMFAMNDSSAKPVKVFVCGVSQPALYVSESKVWHPLSPCSISIHNISSRYLTIDSTSLIAVGLLLHSQDSQAPDDQVSFNSRTGTVEWHGFTIDKEHLFTWPYHIALRETCLEEPMVF